MAGGGVFFVFCFFLVVGLKNQEEGNQGLPRLSANATATASIRKRRRRGGGDWGVDVFLMLLRGWRGEEEEEGVEVIFFPPEKK